MGQWQKGQSGNLKGRPPKSRALAERLQAALDAPVLVDGTLRARGDVLAEMLVQAALTLSVPLPPDAKNAGRAVNLRADEWLALVRYIGTQVDKEPPAGAALLALELDAMVQEIMGDGADADAPADDDLPDAE